MVRVTLSIDGGLAYLPARNTARVLDIDALPDLARDEVCALIEALRRSPPRSVPTQAPDARTYTIGIVDGANTTRYRFSDPISDERCAALLDALRRHLA